MFICAVCGQPLVDNVLDGYNTYCMAYGPAGAGKTYTLHGGLGSLAESGCGGDAAGLTPRVLQALVRRLQEAQPAGAPQATISCSALHICNEQLTDLLRPDSQPLELQDGSAGVTVVGLHQPTIVNGAIRTCCHARPCPVLPAARCMTSVSAGLLP